MGDSAEQQTLGLDLRTNLHQQNSQLLATGKEGLGAQKGLRRGRPLWSPELWVTQVRRMAELRGADSRLPWAALSFSPTATDRLLHSRDPKGEGTFVVSVIPAGPTSE